MRHNSLTKLGRGVISAKVAKMDRVSTNMQKETVLETIRNVMVDVFDLDDLSISYDTTAQDIEEWDRLSHIRLVVALEREFGVRFSNAEIEGLGNVGALVDLLVQKSQ